MATCEFDFPAEQIDERIVVLPIPHGRNQSLRVSRFKQENMSSHRKILQDLESFIQDSKNKQNQRIKLLKQKQKKLGQQMMKQQAYKQMRRRELQDQQKQKIFSQCTFKPKINNQKGPKRNFNQFLQNQYAHSQKVKDKCEQMKKNIEQKKQKGTYKPKINTNYSRRKQSTESSTVFDRLYALSQKQKVEQPQAGSFHPVINARSKNMVREGPVQELLYEDALRRQERGQQIIQTNTSMSQRVEKPVNYTNQKYAAQKFIKQYFFTLEDLQIETSFHASIEYVVFNELLKKLGFVTNQEEQETKASSVQRSLVHDAYQLLQKTKVNARNVCVFLLGLIGIYHINPVNFQEGEEPDPQKQLNLDQVEGRKLQKQFNLFYRNRLSSQANRKLEQKNESFTFQPSINKQSAEMAEKYRNVMLEQANKLLQECPELQFKIPEDGVISHTQLLVLHKMAKDLQKEKQKQQKVDEQLKQCTFKPNTIISSLSCSKAAQINMNAGAKKSAQLYEYYKQIKYKKQSLQASRHQQADPQCTFKPQINKNKPPKLPLVPPSKQTQQTLYRLHKGRQEYEEKQKFFERGERVKERKQSLKEQTQQIPTLILDVNLGEKVDRIVLYRGDQNRLELVARQFAQKHFLDQESKRKLLEMLRTELENVLSKIDEDEQSQQFEQ